MESITTSIFETAKTWTCVYDDNGHPDEQETVWRIITEISDFSAELYMPTLTPIMEAVCFYAQHCENPDKVANSVSVLRYLMELENAIRTHSLVLGVLGTAYEKRNKCKW